MRLSGDGSVERRLGRGRTQEVKYKLRVHVFTIISHQSEIDPKEAHARGEFIEFCDSLVQVTVRTREMPEVPPNDLRGFSKPEREFQENDVAVRLVCAAAVSQSTVAG